MVLGASRRAAGQLTDLQQPKFQHTPHRRCRRRLAYRCTCAGSGRATQPTNSVTQLAIRGTQAVVHRYVSRLVSLTWTCAIGEWRTAESRMRGRKHGGHSVQIHRRRRGDYLQTPVRPRGWCCGAWCWCVDGGMLGVGAEAGVGHVICMHTLPDSIQRALHKIHRDSLCRCRGLGGEMMMTQLASVVVVADILIQHAFLSCLVANTSAALVADDNISLWNKCDRNKMARVPL